MAESDIDRSIEILTRRGRVSLQALGLELGLSDRHLEAVRAELVDVLEIADEPKPGLLVARSTPAADAAPEARHRAERRQVTFLLCDVVSSTELAARLDPEDLRDLMLRYQALCNDAVERFGGHISQWIGDGVVVYFGFPDAHDDDAVRAVRAALQIVESTMQLAPATDGTRLGVRVGLHTGPVVVGDLGAGDGSETLAFGQTPNICARIEAAAEPNSVFVSEHTFELVQGYVDAEDRGFHELKGVAEPMRLLRVTGTNTARDRFEATGALRGIAPLIGREAEHGRLQRAWARAAGGEPAALLLVGEPGIGKSRLVHAARELDDRPGTSLEFHSSPYDRASALYPVIFGLSIHWGLPAAADDDARRARIAAAVGECPELDPSFVVPWLCEMLGVAGGPAEPVDASMTPQRRRAMTLQALATIVLSIADASRPLVLIVEDAHWSDASTGELLHLILGQVDQHPILVLATARPEYLDRADALTNPAPGSIPTEVIELEPLTNDDAVTLARVLIGDDPIVQQVADSADGIPLFVEELALALRDEADPGAASGAERRIPPTLQSCLQARLDRLSPAARALAQFGAAVGRSFDLGLVQRAREREGDDDFGAQLAELESALLVQERPVGSRRYEFRHALIQEAAAASVLRADARAHHRSIADALLSTDGSRPELIARHLSEAGEEAASIEYWQVAGLSALQRSAMSEAITHFESAIERLGALEGGPVRDSAELGLRVLYAVPLTLTRGFADPSVRDAYQRAADLCEILGPRAELFPALSGLLTFDIVRAELPAAINRARENLVIAEESGIDDLIVVAEQDLGAPLFYAGQARESIDHLERAIARSNPEVQHEGFIINFARDPVVVAELHRGVAELVVGMPDRGLASTSAAVARAERWPHPFSLLWAKTTLCLVHVLRREVEVAGAMAGDVVAAATEQGFPNWMSQNMVYLGWATANAGQVDEGLALVRQGREIWSMTGSQLVVPMFELVEAELCCLAGDDDTALARLDAGWTSSHLHGELWVASELRRLAGDIARRLGDREAASSHYADALEHAERYRLDGFALRVDLSMAAFDEEPSIRGQGRARLVERLTRIEGGTDTWELRAAAQLLAT